MTGSLRATVRTETCTGRRHVLSGHQNDVTTFILFDDSGEEVRRLMGAQSRELLEGEIERILGP